MWLQTRSRILATVWKTMSSSSDATVLSPIGQAIRAVEAKIAAACDNSSDKEGSSLARLPRLVAVSKTKPEEAIVEAYAAGQRHFGENYVKELVSKSASEFVKMARLPRLVAVSKTKPEEAIVEAYAAGQRHFGENYVKELVSKSASEFLRKEAPDIKWHFIGHLQSNKVKKLVACRNLYQLETVDSTKLADELEKCLSQISSSPPPPGSGDEVGAGSERLRVMVQVNTSGEEGKSGIEPKDAVGVVKHLLSNCPRLEFVGLMTIGDYEASHNIADGPNPDFMKLREVRDQVCNELELQDVELSMGMSADYEHARLNNGSEMGLSEYLGTLGDNPYFSAGFGLFGVGAGAAILRKVSQSALILFRRHYVMTLEVPCRDKSYDWLLRWITVKGARKTQHLSVATKFQEATSGKIVTRYDFIPSIGVHFFRFHNRWIRVERTREQSTIDLHQGIPFETVTLTALGRDRQLYFEILEDARQIALEEYQGRTVMYTAMGSEWRQLGQPKKRRPLQSVVLADGVSEKLLGDVKEFIANPAWYSDRGEIERVNNFILRMVHELGQPKKRRPLQSVVLADGVSEKLLGDVKEFIANPAWYSDRGIPYRRGYLLYGPPGCGKSSFIFALAGALEYGICVLNLSERGLSDDRLNHLLAVAPEQSIILLEDIDAAFVSREESPNVRAAFEGLSRLTLSGLLNALDGVASSEGRLLFMTTNYKERLDAALIRPGRVDVQEFVGYCSPEQAAAMFNNFYPDAAAGLAGRFERVVAASDATNKLSPAFLQGFFLMHKTDPEGSVEAFVKQFGGIAEHPAALLSRG
ncbi:unnamed protein product [Notodromas monacha]|uniref:Pyridoxal phosphate homeostasis protein n=1 Tax=Notodromas monacha TaxID=399045 RepID=A0A7R9BJE7_9CRUS|nr:unnamed protein product [Notodromas monacha]CAG0915737.1 unnamed protein product [Notodromas monacha]